MFIKDIHLHEIKHYIKDAFPLSTQEVIFTVVSSKIFKKINFKYQRISEFKPTVKVSVIYITIETQDLKNIEKEESS